MSNSQKSISPFPHPHHEADAKRPDEAASYLAYLLDLADRLFNGNQREHDDEAA